MSLSKTPWVDRAMSTVWDRIAAAAPQASWVPQHTRAGARGGKSGKVQVAELGCGHYGCVMPTDDDGIVCKLTSDATEAVFVAAALSLGEIPEGLVSYKRIYAIPGAHRGRPLFVLWREAATVVGLTDVMQRAGATAAHRNYAEYEVNALHLLGRFLQHFKTAASDVRDRLKGADPDGSLEQARRSREWAWEAAMEFDWERDTSREILTRLTHSQGPTRLALGLAICEQLVEHMENTYGCDMIGGALGHYLERGILLADVHGNNVGLTERSGKICVITDPGHAVPLDRKWSNVHVPELP